MRLERLRTEVLRTVEAERRRDLGDGAAGALERSNFRLFQDALQHRHIERQALRDTSERVRRLTLVSARGGAAGWHVRHLAAERTGDDALVRRAALAHVSSVSSVDVLVPQRLHHERLQTARIEDVQTGEDSRVGEGVLAQLAYQVCCRGT